MRSNLDTRTHKGGNQKGKRERKRRRERAVEASDLPDVDVALIQPQPHLECPTSIWQIRQNHSGRSASANDDGGERNQQRLYHEELISSHTSGLAELRDGVTQVHKGMVLTLFLVAGDRSSGRSYSCIII